MSVIQGNTIRQYLDENGMSVQDLSNKLDVSRQTLYKYFEKKSLDEDFINKLKIIGIDIVNYKNKLPTKIPYYDIDFMAGTAEVFSEPERPDYYIDIPPFNNCDLALPIFGDSMYPIYQNGDIVMCREIKDKSIIPLGEAFLIVTKEHRMLKYLKRGPSPDTLLAVSENSEQYDPFPIKIDNMERIYIVKGVIKRKTI